MFKSILLLVAAIVFSQVSFGANPQKPSRIQKVKMFFPRPSSKKLSSSTSISPLDTRYVAYSVRLGASLILDFEFDISSAFGGDYYVKVLDLGLLTSPNVTVLSNNCIGKEFHEGIVDSCHYIFAYTPVATGSETLTFHMNYDDQEFSSAEPITNYDVTSHITFKTFGGFPKCAQSDSGSIISVDSQTLGEEVPIVGAPFTLRYSTSFSSSYQGNSLTAVPFFHTDGITLSTHHYYDATQGQLYRGTGGMEAVSYQTQTSGNNLVVSSGGDEVYIFAPSGKHLETKTFLTGATKYTFGYDSSDRLVSVTDGYGLQTTLHRDSSGNLTSIQSPYGQTTSVVVNSSGLVSSVTNPNSETYFFTYKTGTDLLETFTKPGGQTSTHTYDSSGLLTEDLGAGGNFWSIVQGTTYNFDKSSALGRTSHYNFSSGSSYKRTEITPFGMENDYVEGTETKSYNSIGMEQTLQADDERFGSLYQRITSSDTKMGGVDRITTYGQTVSGTTDPFSFTSIVNTSTTDGHTYSNTYTASTKTFVETSPAGATQTTTLNSHEQPTSITTGSDTAWTFTYDTNGRISQLTQGSRGTVNYAYNTAGYLQSITNALSEVTSYLYDLAGRVTQVTLPDSRVISYSYDANGNLTSVTPPSKPAHGFTFNLFETLDTYSPPALTGLTTKNTTYTYNLDKQLTKITRPDAQEATYVYDGTTGQISSLQLPTGNYTYTWKTQEDRIDNISSPDDFNNKFGYYGYKIASDTLRKTSTNFLYGMTSFTYDADHRVSSRTVRGNSATDTSTINYTYNNDDKLVAAGDLSLAYEYPSGRLSTTSIGKISDSRTYDAYGELQTYTAIYTPTTGSPQTLYSYTFTRDAIGRIATKTETVQGVTDVYAYSYDNAGRLTQVLKNTAAYSSYT